MYNLVHGGFNMAFGAFGGPLLVARTCNGMALPCSPGDFGRCVSAEQAKSLFDAGDWSFHHKYTFKVCASRTYLWREMDFSMV